MISRLLVARTDRLGDFMLAWPAFRLLKEAIPQLTLVALVQEYTRPMAELCPWLDEIIIDRGEPDYKGLRALASRLRAADVDGAIALFSNMRIAAALALARVPYRLGPATKLAQLLYTVRLRQQRSKSVKPEFEYNADLARHFLKQQGKGGVPTPMGPYLSFPPDMLALERINLGMRLGISPESFWVFVHPGSGGSANNLRSDQYGELCSRLSNGERSFVITAGPSEVEVAKRLADTVKGAPVAVLSPDGLPELTRQLAIADLFISGSTGPLHIAGALDRPTATFYPGHRSGSRMRWQTLNRAEIRLAFSPPPGGDPKDVARIDVAKAAEDIEKLLTGLSG